jgi:hypothetical protein
MKATRTGERWSVTLDFGTRDADPGQTATIHGKFSLFARFRVCGDSMNFGFSCGGSWLFNFASGLFLVSADS